MTDERIVCGLVAIASAIVIASVLSRSPEPEEVVPVPTCSWPSERCCVQPPRLQVAWLRDLRAAKWGRE